MATLAEIVALMEYDLDVDTTENRYPQTMAYEHVNAAIANLQRRYSTPYDEGSTTFLTVVGQRSYVLDSAIPATAKLLIDSPQRVWYISDQLGTTLTGTWTVDDGSTDVTSGAGAATSELEAGDTVYIPGDGEDNLYIVDSVTDDDNIVLTSAHDGGASAVAMTLFEGGSEECIVELTSFELAEFRDHQPVTDDDGEPEAYMLRSGKLIMGPGPEAIFLMRVDHRGRQRELSAGSNTNEWTLKAHRLVKAEANRLASLYLLEDEGADKWAAEVQRLGDELAIDLSQRGYAGRFLDPVEL